jgi:hypothetical protein
MIARILNDNAVFSETSSALRRETGTVLVWAALGGATDFFLFAEDVGFVFGMLITRH